MEDKSEQNQIKGPRSSAFSVHLPIELNGKVEYIKKRTFLSKQRIILMTCSKNIESWCKQLMDEELAIRTAGGKVVPKPMAPPAMPIETPPPIHPPFSPYSTPNSISFSPNPHPQYPPSTSPTAPFPQFKEDVWIPANKPPDKTKT